MAFTLNDKPLAVDVPFTVGDINYPANWLRLSTAKEKTDLGIKEVADPVIFDQRFYYEDGRAVIGIDGEKIQVTCVKTTLKNQEKYTAAQYLSEYDWYVIRKAEKDTAIPSSVTTYRDAVRTACDTREKEIDACSDTAALVTLFGATFDKDGNFEKFNMTQYPEKPNV